MNTLRPPLIPVSRPKAYQICLQHPPLLSVPSPSCLTYLPPPLPPAPAWNQRCDSQRAIRISGTGYHMWLLGTAIQPMDCLFAGRLPSHTGPFACARHPALFDRALPGSGERIRVREVTYGLRSQNKIRRQVNLPSPNGQLSTHPQGLDSAWAGDAEPRRGLSTKDTCSGPVHSCAEPLD